MAWRLITVTQMLATKYGELRCQRCNRRLEVGEEAWSHRSTERRSRAALQATVFPIHKNEQRDTCGGSLLNIFTADRKKESLRRGISIDLPKRVFSIVSVKTS